MHRDIPGFACLASAVQDEPESPGGDSGFMDDLGFGEGRDPAAADPRPWRLAALVGVICIVVLLLAIALLNVGGGGRKPTDVGLPSVSNTPSAALPTPTEASGTVPTTPSAATPTTPTPTTTHPHTSAHPSHTTHPATTTAAASTSATPTPQPHTSTVVPTPSPVPSVAVSAGARDYRCGNNCRFVVVRLANLAGSHLVQCFSAGGHLYGGDTVGAAQHQYVTESAVSYTCSFRGPGAVWVVVDGKYESNHVSW